VSQKQDFVISLGCISVN